MVFLPDQAPVPDFVELVRPGKGYVRQVVAHGERIVADGLQPFRQHQRAQALAVGERLGPQVLQGFGQFDLPQAVAAGEGLGFNGNDAVRNDKGLHFPLEPEGAFPDGGDRVAVLGFRRDDHVLRYAAVLNKLRGAVLLDVIHIIPFFLGFGTRKAALQAEQYNHLKPDQPFETFPLFHRLRSILLNQEIARQ